MAASRNGGLKDRVVAVVEDDLAVLGSLAFSLRVEGFSVRTYACAEHALQDPLICEAECLVVDYKLPGMNGLDLLAELRCRCIDAPAILVATDPNANVRNSAALMHVPVIEKPLLGEELFREIRAALPRR
jgi:two-component system response regulator FixJ